MTLHDLKLSPSSLSPEALRSLIYERRAARLQEAPNQATTTPAFQSLGWEEQLEVVERMRRGGINKGEEVMGDARWASFNDGYKAHDKGQMADNFGNEHIAEYFEEGWDTACHYNASGTYDELMDGAWQRCDAHQGFAPQDRKPSPPGYLTTCTGGQQELANWIENWGT